MLESPKSIIEVGALLDESLAADSLLITLIVLGKYKDSWCSLYVPEILLWFDNYFVYGESYFIFEICEKWALYKSSFTEYYLENYVSVSNLESS